MGSHIFINGTRFADGGLRIEAGIHGGMGLFSGVPKSLKKVHITLDREIVLVYHTSVPLLGICHAMKWEIAATPIIRSDSSDIG